VPRRGGVVEKNKRRIKMETEQDTVRKEIIRKYEEKMLELHESIMPKQEKYEKLSRVRYCWKKAKSLEN